MRYVLMEAASKVKRVNRFKCPYCEERYIRSDLVIHVQRKHEELIPEGYTACRVVFNYLNHKDGGKCMICQQPTAWNEVKGRYESLCGRQSCKEAYKKMVRERNQNTYGTDDPTKDPRYAEEIQKKALANRSISGNYKFSDGGLVGYTGSYERKLLEFLDKIMYVSSTDIISPGPTIHYQYGGQDRLYISDFLYIPYNLIIEVKDGKANPANNIGEETREKTLAKEQAVRDGNKYNYVRLTDNNFAQLMEIMAMLKFTLEDNTEQHIVKINESAASLFNGAIVGPEKGHFIVQDLQNNVYNVTKDPTQSTMISIHPETHKVCMISKKDIPGPYITFRLKDWDKAEELYSEAEDLLKSGKTVNSTSYFYERYINGNVLTKDQIMFDESCKFIKNFDDVMHEYVSQLEQNIIKINHTPTNIDLLEEQMIDLLKENE